MNRLFDPEQEALQLWAPTVDVVEHAHALVVHAELPGMQPDDIRIQVEGDTLILKGHRAFHKEEKDTRFVRIERSYGAFQRTFTLGVPVKVDEVTATYTQGVLEITLPKAEAAKPKAIPVTMLDEAA